MDESSFICAICLEIADEAVETNCCHHLFCERCLNGMLERPCPHCRKNLKVEVAHFARRIIGNMMVECKHSGCELKISRSELEQHQSKCEHRLYTCPSKTCVFSGSKRNFATHLCEAHQTEVVNNAEKCFLTDEQKTSTKDRIRKTTNKYGRSARLGESGKYYCAGRLDINYRYCSCCDAHCGPTNGCNCSGCMELDIAARQLPRHWYVNRQGATARRSKENGRMYCGRRVLVGTPGCDGYCGPENGPNCQSCAILDSQIATRYA
ncbi:E3 ubiquitin-protein ligase NRDP1-like [Hydractinia symbiolongicarpus]|uniref:E3 ubiquitin-protein ligase NRDP1-like n=1 Tax=Hydractinia symbiolongicarpus TaxID=13093 RepID=UPI002549D99E|nr:E3 ubiquitin-protein ligase NRDP1-like [Hydractinia symbiolongicarpus]